MNIYQLLPQNPFTGKSDTAINFETATCFPFDPANTDYQTFKAQVLTDEAQLEDADGNLMTAEQAKEFIKTLP